MANGFRIATAISLVALAATAATPYGNGDFGPYLTNVTETGITVSWETGDPGNSRVVYGLTATLGSQVDDPTSVNHHEARIEGLTAATTYYYRVETDGVFASQLSTFDTAPKEDAPVRFVFFAETHSNSPLRCVSQAVFEPVVTQFAPDLLINVGDHVDEGDDINMWQTYFDETSYFLPETVTIDAWGNHDDNKNSQPTDPMDQHVLLLFDEPGNERYYSVRYGNILFIMLDPMWAYDGQSAQALAWLEGLLQEASDGIADPPYIVAGAHAPMYGANKYAADTCTDVDTACVTQPTQWLRDNVVPLFESYSVSAFLGGHEMLYAHAIKQGVHYFQVSSSDRERTIEAASQYLVAVDRRPAILMFDATCAQMRYEAWGPKGQFILGAWTNEQLIPCAVSASVDGFEIIDQGSIMPRGPCVIDDDRDGFEAAVDCDDNDASIYPNAAEICDDGVDQDCDQADLACAAGGTGGSGLAGSGGSAGTGGSGAGVGGSATGGTDVGGNNGGIDSPSGSPGLGCRCDTSSSKWAFLAFMVPIAWWRRRRRTCM